MSAKLGQVDRARQKKKLVRYGFRHERRQLYGLTVLCRAKLRPNLQIQDLRQAYAAT